MTYKNHHFSATIKLFSSSFSPLVAQFPLQQCVSQITGKWTKEVTKISCILNLVVSIYKFAIQSKEGKETGLGGPVCLLALIFDCHLRIFGF